MSAGAMERVLSPPTSYPMSQYGASPIARSASAASVNRKRAFADSDMNESYDQLSPGSYGSQAGFAGPFSNASSMYSSSPASSGSNPFTSPPSYHSSPASSVPSLGGSPVFTRDSASPVKTGASLGEAFLPPALGAPYDSQPFDNLLKTPKSEVRPGLKRRKTAPAECSPSKGSPGKRSPERRGSGKDGQEVWPEDVEDAFFKALNIIPKLGRRKVLVNHKPCGRNELIADYIFRKTGKLRSRKQVSSHIQVLKNIRRDDADFMRLVAEPVEGVDDVFTPEAIAAFGGTLHGDDGDDSPPMEAPSMMPSLSESYLSPSPPRTMPQAMMYRSASCGPAPLLSPALSDCSSVHSALPSPFPSPYAVPMSTSSSLNSAFEAMSYPFPRQGPVAQIAPRVIPAELCVWAESAEATHVYTKLMGNSLNITETVFLEDLPMFDTRFPGLANMHSHIACQFLYVKLNLLLPHVADAFDKINTQLLLNAGSSDPLLSVTTVYRDGAPIHLKQEALPAAQPANKRASPSADGSSPSSVESNSPTTPSSAGNSPTAAGPQQRFAYAANLAPDLWNTDLTGPFNEDRQSLLISDLARTAIIQELVLPSEKYDAMPCSNGSAVGEVMAVIVYDVEVVKDFSHAAAVPSAQVSFLSVRKPANPPSNQLAVPNANRLAHQPRRPSTLSQSTTSSGDVPEIKLEVAPEMTTLAAPTAVKGHRTRPSLTLKLGLPAAPTSSAGPLTPAGQLVSTPLHPPEMNQTGDSARLYQVWHNQANANNWTALESPALVGSFPGMGSANQLNMMTSSALAAPTPGLMGYSQPLSTPWRPEFAPIAQPAPREHLLPLAAEPESYFSFSNFLASP